MFVFEKGVLVIDADMIAMLPAYAVMYNKDDSPNKRFSWDIAVVLIHMRDARSGYAHSPLEGRLTNIVTKVFEDEAKHPEIHEWFKKHYIPVKVNAAKAKAVRGRKKKDEETPPKEEVKEVIHTDPLFERALQQYLNEQNMLPEHAMLEAGETAVHRLAAQIRDPNNRNATDDLGKMNKAMEDLKKLRSSTRAAEEQERSSRGDRTVRKREDPNYIFMKQRL